MASPSILSSVRAHLNREDLGSAEALLAPLLKQTPTDSELNALQAEIELYSQHEPQAIGRLKFIQDRSVVETYGQHLADFLFCRDQLAAKLGAKCDTVGDALKEQLFAHGSWTPSPDIGIGVSACLIVKNEAAHLDRCLSSLSGFVDEIVVVDTGSSDDTVSIAERYGARLGSFEWCQDFSAARNVALGMASQPWILWIDADEEIVSGSEAMWQEALIRPHFAGYMLRIVNFLESTGERTEFVHTPVRLFRNHASHRFEGRIHEQISPSLVAQGGRIASLSAVTLNHYGYLPDLMADRQKVQRTLEMIARELEDDPENPFQLFNLAMTHSVAQDYVSCEKVAKKCASVLGANELIGANVYHLWALSLLAQERYDEVCAVTSKSEEKGYHSLLIEYERTQALLHLKKLDLALKSSKRCLAMEWPERLTGDTSVATHKRYLLHARILIELDRAEDALNCLESVPQTSDSTGLRAGALFKLGRWKESLNLFESLYEHPVKRLSARLYGAQCHFELGEYSQTTRICRQRQVSGAVDEEGFRLWVLAAERGGDSSEILEAYEAYTRTCPPMAETLINWGRAFQESGQYDRALSCYTEAHKLDPTDGNVLLNSGDVLYLMENFLEAVHFYEQALRLDMDNHQAWFVLGNCLLQIGALDGAVGAYEQCLQRNPEHEGAIHNKGLIGEIRAGTLAA